MLGLLIFWIFNSAGSSDPLSDFILTVMDLEMVIVLLLLFLYTTFAIKEWLPAVGKI